MGAYTTRLISEQEIKDIILTIRNGYSVHRPNIQIATILLLQANLGCRINDIVHLSMENIVYDGDAWKLNLIEQKTGKERPFIIPKPVKKVIDKYAKENNITEGRLFHVSAQAVWKALRNVCEYLELEEISCHSFRKAAALRTYINSGKDIALVTQFLNHSSPTVSMRYIKRSTKQLDDVLTRSTCLF